MAEEPGLFEDEESAPSPFFAAVDAAERKLGGRGRPPGALNRKTKEFEKWFGAMGFKDPAQYLAEIYAMDPLALYSQVAAKGVTLLDVVRLQVAAAGELLPYLHGKKPTEVLVTDDRLPMLMIITNSNQLAEAQQLLEERQAMSAGVPLTIDQTPANAGVSEDEE